jgi:P-type Ca2+ transporter type 2C
VIINAVIGFLQEHRAERAVMALRSMTAPRARVMRDGHRVMMPANGIAPGDVLVLEAGDVAAADARLRTAHALTTNEAPLTGESTPVEKTTAPTGPDTPLAERHDFVFMGTSVATGTGLAEIIATGMQTELGRIAHLLSTAEESVTPLQRRLARVSQTLLYVCGGIVALVALAGLQRGWPLLQVFMAAVSLAVAAVPEGTRRRRAANGGAPRADPKVACRGNARLRHGDLHRQDGHAHNWRHAGARALGP